MKENNNILYLCDHRKCDECHDYCNHTSNIKHAINFENVNGTYKEKIWQDKETIIQVQKESIDTLKKDLMEAKRKLREYEFNDNSELQQIVIDKQKENKYTNLYRKGKLEISFMPIVKTRKYTFCGETTNVQDFENSYIKVLRVEPDMKVEEKLFEYNTKGKAEFMEYMLEYIIPTPMKEDNQ